MGLDIIKNKNKDRVGKVFKIFQSRVSDNNPIELQIIEQIEITVRTMYDQNHRFYHNIKHINACLKSLHEYCKETNYNPEHNHDILKFSIVMHDSIYSSGNDTDEIHSYFLARVFASQLGEKLFKQDLEDVNDQMESLIYVTTHAIEPSFKNKQNCDEAIIADCDLSILGTSPEIYNKYTKNIKKEYSNLRDSYHNKMRFKFLNQLASKDSIYWTEYFKDTYGKQARENIGETLKQLKDLVY